MAQALTLDANEVEERLEKLERVFAFVTLTSEAEFPNRTLTLRYRFVHVLYQNALLTALRATRKATLSRAVAQALEGFVGERTALLATELALLWEAARVNAHREAVHLAERGLEALLKLPDTPARNRRELGLQLALGFSWQSVLSWAAPGAGAAFTRARQLCQPMGDDPRFFAALVGVWAYHLVRAQYDTAHGVCELMLHLAEKSQDPALLVVASMCWAKVHYFQGDLASSQQLGERALALDRRESHDAYLAVYNEDGGLSARREHSFCLWMRGYPDRALALAYERRPVAEGRRQRCAAGSGKLLSPSHRDRPAAEREIAGTARHHEPRALVPAAGQVWRGTGDPRRDLWLVYGRLRDSGPEGGEGVAGGIAR